MNPTAGKTRQTRRPAWRWQVACLAIIGAGLISLLITPISQANETDQFLLPPDAQWADLGEFLSGMHHMVINDAVRYVNGRIAQALAMDGLVARQRALDRWQSPEALADAVRLLWGRGFWEMYHVEGFLYSEPFQNLYPGKLVAHRSWDWIYRNAHLPLDPRNIPLLFRSSTVKVFGVYVGTDKFGHMHDLGHIYYKDYLWGLNNGADEPHARQVVVHRFSQGPISERMIIGFWATGVFSNADLAANYIGFKFYRNLTEPVELQGRWYPPILVRDGDYWAFNDHVEPKTLLKPFITDHLNEALNPSLYEWPMRQTIRRRLLQQAEDIVQAYADEHGQPRPPQWFRDKARELRTWYGQDYGHMGHDGNLITIADIHPDTQSDEPVHVVLETQDPRNHLAPMP